MQSPLAYRNRRLIPAAELVLSPTDAGFVQGSTVAEQLRTFAGRVFRLDDHLARLEHSLTVIGVDPGLDRQAMTAAALEIVEHNHRLLTPGDDLGLSIFVTPGEYPSYVGEPGPIEPLVCMHTYPLPFRLWAEKYRTGQVLVTTDIQQVPARCWPTALKCRSRMHYHLADRKAALIEPDSRALLLDEQGRVTETSTANILLSTAAGLVTPPVSRVLPGISLAEVHELAAGLGILSAERDLALDEVAAANEVLLTSTPLCLLPVTRLNGRPLGNGRPGPVFRRLLDAWSQQVGLDIVAQAERFSRRRSR